MQELKSCPFCGSENVSLSTVVAGELCVVCGTCEAGGPEAHKSEAVRLWNAAPRTGADSDAERQREKRHAYLMGALHEAEHIRARTFDADERSYGAKKAAAAKEYPITRRVPRVWSEPGCEREWRVSEAGKLEWRRPEVGVWCEPADHTEENVRALAHILANPIETVTE